MDDLLFAAAKKLLADGRFSQRQYERWLHNQSLGGYLQMERDGYYRTVCPDNDGFPVGYDQVKIG